MHPLRYQRFFPQHEVCAVIIDVREIDRLRMFLAEEEKYLLSRSDNRWAEEYDRNELAKRVTCKKCKRIMANG